MFGIIPCCWPPAINVYTHVIHVTHATRANCTKLAPVHTRRSRGALGKTGATRAVSCTAVAAKRCGRGLFLFDRVLLGKGSGGYIRRRCLSSTNRHDTSAGVPRPFCTATFWRWVCACIPDFSSSCNYLCLCRLEHTHHRHLPPLPQCTPFRLLLFPHVRLVHPVPATSYPGAP